MSAPCNFCLFRNVWSIFLNYFITNYQFRIFFLLKIRNVKDEKSLKIPSLKAVELATIRESVSENEFDKQTAESVNKIDLSNSRESYVVPTILVGLVKNE